MKLTFLFLTAAVLSVSAKSIAQTQVTFTGKDVSLKTVFDVVKAQTGFLVTYTDEVLKDTKRVTVTANNQPLEEFLKTVFKDQPVKFEIKSKTILLSRKDNISLPIGEGRGGVGEAVAVPANIDVKGRVVNEDGEVVTGASVRVKGGTIGTTTNNDGDFILKLVDENAVLMITGANIENTEITVKGRRDMGIVSAKIKVGSLNEVIVNRGYYTQKQVLSTGDVTTVKGVDIQKQPVTDPILALEGRVPGLNIQQASGAPGAYSNITIRGQNSIANGNDPLYIVDGVPFSSVSLTSTNIGGGSVGRPSAITGFTSNGSGLVSGGAGMSPFNSLNPSDIESIDVLKDADATAIYGSRGANGVILITTKKGKAGNTRFNLNAYTGGGKVTRVLDLLNTQQYLAMLREAYKNDGLPVPSFTTTPTNIYYDINGVWDTARYTNWEKTLIGNTAQFTNIQGDLSGGTANSQFLIGGGYSQQGTVFPGSYSDQKMSTHFNLTHASADQRFHTQFTASYVYDNSNLPQSDLTRNIGLAPDAPAIYDANGKINWQPLNGKATWSNPLAGIVAQAKASTNNLISNLGVSYRVFDGLELKSSFGYTHTQMNQNILSPATASAPPDDINPANRINNFATTDFQTWIIEPQVNYQKNISKGRLNVTFGTTFQQDIKKSIAQTTSGYASDALISNPLAASTIKLAANAYFLYRYSALFGRIGYNWKEKYLINITARRDGSSRFGPGKQFGNFGAIGAGWVFSKERFFQNNFSLLSFGKLKASYGSTGNDQIPDYQYLSSYSSLPSTYQGITGLYPAQLVNPYFGWELVKKIEGSLEIGLLKDRIFISASYYRDRTGNQLVGYPLSYITGFSSIQFNLPAIVQNSGWEFTITAVNIRDKNFTWKSAVNLTLPVNKLIAYPHLELSSYNNVFIIGQPISVKKLYQYTGVDPQKGVYTFATKNANGIPSNPQDAVSIIPITQKFYGGFENSFAYKGFQLDILVQFTKQVKYNYLGNFGLPGASFNNQPVTVLGRWQQPGDNSSIQKFTTSTSGQAGAANSLLLGSPGSDRSVSDGSFIRLKNLSFSYQLPIGWQKKAHLHNARLYFQCQNLFTYTKFRGLDPETGGLSLPPLRMITAGIQLAL
jgi:TonB-linked SusC/RagA family outer membrane protein